MSNHIELRDLRSESIHFKNKFMILKITLMPQIKEAFVWSNVNTKSILQYSFRVLFWCLIYTHNILKELASFICSYFIKFKFKVCVLAGVIIGTCSTWYFEDFFFSCHEWKYLFAQKCASNYQTYLENQLNNFCTWNSSLLMKYHTSDSAEWNKKYMSTIRGSGVLVLRDLLH